MQSRFLQVRPGSVGAIVRILESDSTCPEGLTDTIRAGQPINLDAPRSAEAAAYDGESATVGGYLLALCRDKFENGLAGWSEFVALGALAADVENANERT